VWTCTARMSRSATVDTTPDRAWSLLASPAAYSLLHMYEYVFELPVRPQAGGRLFFTVGRGPGLTTGQIFEVTDEHAGRRIHVVSRSAQQLGLRSLNAVMSPKPHGVHIELAIEVLCPRDAKTEYQTHMARDLKDWLAAVSEVLTGRARWPPAELPAELRQAIGTAPPMERPLTVSDSVYIDASPDLVWRATSSPEAGRMSQQALYAGYVPGPPSADGPVAYTVADRGQWGLLGAVSVRTETEAGRLRGTTTKGYAPLTSRLLVTPAGRGSTLEIAVTAAGPADQAQWEAVQSAYQASLTARLGRYKTVIEEPEALG
jgi:Polyketide cyclase / dehydrase and lipid transport